MYFEYKIVLFKIIVCSLTLPPCIHVLLYYESAAPSNVYPFGSDWGLIMFWYISCPTRHMTAKTVENHENFSTTAVIAGKRKYFH
jgi:hypothetical protein